MLIKTLFKSIAAISFGSYISKQLVIANKETKSFINSRFNIESNKIPKSFNNYKIIQITDLHSAIFGDKQKDLIETIKKEEPDLICITGDLFEPNKANDNAIDLLNGIQNIAPIYYVIGNHETRIMELNHWLKVLERYHVNVLKDNGAILTKNNQSIQLLGLSDPTYHINQKDYESKYKLFDKILKQLRKTYQKDYYTMLLSHRPELIDVYAKYDIDLVLTGHAHGGQIQLPFIKALYAPGQGLFPRYYEGYYQKGTTIEIVSRGLGCSHLELRYNSKPELVIISLISNL